MKKIDLDRLANACEEMAQAALELTRQLDAIDESPKEPADPTDLNAARWQVIRHACIGSRGVVMRVTDSALLTILLDQVQPETFAGSGRLMVQISHQKIQELTWLKRQSVYQASDRLIQLGIIRKDPGNGHAVSLFEIIRPK